MLLQVLHSWEIWIQKLLKDFKLLFSDRTSSNLLHVSFTTESYVCTVCGLCTVCLLFDTVLLCFIVSKHFKLFQSYFHLYSFNLRICWKMAILFRLSRLRRARSSLFLIAVSHFIYHLNPLETSDKTFLESFI